MESIVESLSYLKLDNLLKMKKSYKKIYKDSPNDENLENLTIIEKAIQLKEDATANAGSVGGMGNVVAAQPSSVPGVPGTSGSGDYGMPLFGTAQSQTPAFGLGKLINKIKGSKKLQKKLKGKKLLSYNDFIKKK